MTLVSVKFVQLLNQEEVRDLVKSFGKIEKCAVYLGAAAKNGVKIV